MALSHAQQVQLARQGLGYQGPFSGGAFQNFLTQNNKGGQWNRLKNQAMSSRPSSGGVRPLNVATLTPLERMGFEALATPPAGIDMSGTQVSGRVDDALSQMAYYFGQAQDLMGSGFGARMQQLQNPYTEQVVNAALSDLDRQGQRQEMNLRQEANRFNAFGSDSYGVARGELAEGVAREGGNLSGRLRYQGYGDALGLLGQQINALTGMGQTAGSLGLQGAGLTGAGSSDALSNFLRLQQARAGAGATVRGVNQQQLNSAFGNYFGPQEYPWQQLQKAGSALSIFGQQGFTPNAVTQPSTGQQMLGGALAGSQLLEPTLNNLNFGGMRSNEQGPVTNMQALFDPRQSFSFGSFFG